MTSAGRCQNGVAEKCDVKSGTIRRIDCRAMGTECVNDRDRGAVCEDLEALAGGNPCQSDAPQGGACTADGAALWCDPQSGVPQVWSCGDGLSCAENACKEGAWCCDDGSGNSTGSGEDDASCTPCPSDLGYDGACSPDGQIARWCDPDGCLVEVDCAAEGMVCGPGQYAAECVENECSQLGWEGACDPDGAGFRFCWDGTVSSVDCPAGTQCTQPAGGEAGCTSANSGCEADAAEPDDSADQARQVPSGWYLGGYNAYNQTICSGDEDWYAVPLYQGQVLVADLTFTHADGDLDLFLWNQDATEVVESAASVTDDEHLEVTVPLTGTYYVEVSGFDGQNTYDLSMYVSS